VRELLSQPTTWWAIVLIFALPLTIIGAGEVEERLRQRGSALQSSMAVLRTWVLPAFTLWVILRLLFELDRSNPIVVVAGTVLVIAIAISVLSVTSVLVNRLRHRPHVEGRRSVPRLLLAMPRLIVILVASWFLIAGVWQVDLSSALAALGVTSLVVSFALQDTLSGIASGFLLLSDQPFQPGDWVKTGEDTEGSNIEGRVVDTNWRSSRIEDRNGDLRIIPNALLASGMITNFDQPARLHRVVVPVQVAFANPPTLAREMLLSAARATEGVLHDPAPAARVVQIDDPLMGYEVDLWIEDYAIAPRVFNEFGGLVWYHSYRHDVPLPSPAQDLYLWDGVHTAETSRPDRAEVRRRLQRSPLLDHLADADMDQLAVGATPARYSTGETITDGGTGQALFVMWQGQARIVIDGYNDETLTVTDVGAGEVFGLVRSSEIDAAARAPRVVAVTDCEVVIIPADVATAVASRTPELTEALERLFATRQRRLERVLRRSATVARLEPPTGESAS
jgi:small-conductance mechanosensitive channel